MAIRRVRGHEGSKGQGQELNQMKFRRKDVRASFNSYRLQMID